MSVPSGHSKGPLDTPEHGSRVVRSLARASFVAGATGLLATMAIETVAVLGRHVGLPVLGSIELVQAAAAVAPTSVTTSWAGTPAIDVAAGVIEQLTRLQVPVERVAGCTREDEELYSYRRDGVTGRFAGVVLLRGERDA